MNRSQLGKPSGLDVIGQSLSCHLKIMVFLITLLLSFEPLGAEPVFREPFTLQLQIDKDHYYKASLDKTPYVNEGKIYLFKGDNSGE